MVTDDMDDERFGRGMGVLCFRILLASLALHIPSALPCLPALHIFLNSALCHSAESNDSSKLL